MRFLWRKIFWESKPQPATRWMRRIVVTGLTVGVASLIVTRAMVAGFESEYAASLLNFNGHLILPPEGRGDFQKEELVAIFEKEGVADQILSITPYLYREILGVNQGRIKGIILKGVPTVDGLQLGKTLAEEWGGDPKEIRMMIPAGNSSGYRFEKVPVAGTFEVGLHEFDSQFAMIPLADLQKLFHLPPESYGFEIRLKNPGEADRMQSLLAIHLGPFVTLQNWKELHRPLFEALQLERWAFSIVLGLMILTASLNLVGLIVLQVFQRRRMQAILRALGLSVRAVGDLFLREAIFWGSVGIGGGILLGSILALILSCTPVVEIDPTIYFISSIPFRLEILSIFIIAVLGLLLIWVIARIALKITLNTDIREGLHGPGGS